MIRTVIFFKEYFYVFFNEQPLKTQEKIDFVLDLVSFAEKIPVKYFKHIEGTDGLYEIRVQQGNKSIRIFCCFDEGKLVVLFNAFVKKTDKTPKMELDKALNIKNEYFEEKRIAKKRK